MPDAPGYYAQGPEALIVNLAARGDRDAFAELVRRRQPWLRNLMRRLSGDATLADDLAQRVFLKVWQKIRKLRQADRFAGWIKQIAVNEWIDHRRKQGTAWHEAYEDEAQAAPAQTPAAAIDLDAALATLPDPVRTCIVLAYHERLSHPEITELTGLPAGTVKSHIRRGSQKLRDALEAYGGAS
ncbi:MAG: RNA polymerase sigma factor [Pseudomonadota bacterium]